VHEALEKQFGDSSRWRFGDMHQISFWHTLSKREPWQAMQVGPEPLGGSPTTLAMAVHMGKGPGREPGADRVPQRVFHGPAFRLVVDLADPDHCRFVVASGNSGRPGSKHVTDHFPTWLKGKHHTVSLLRDELRVEETWRAE
ncbi:MAG: penicillin acylase family protein, partial [Gammaproteobacteria bacterium]|nr:penicillin acylase family protein [Gammaproteobacteria bacterium]